MRLATLAGVGSFSLVLAACDAVDSPTPPETQEVRFHIAGALKVTIRDLETLGGNFSTATAINRGGTVIGYSTNAAGATHAFRWDGTMHDLGTLEGDFSRAVAINDAGQIAGIGRLPHGTGTCEQTIHNGCRAVFWDAAGTIQNLGTLPGGDFSVATAITETGHVVGYSTTAAGETHAFYWDGTTMHDVGTLSGGNYSVAWDVNERGRVVGSSRTASGELHAFVWNYQNGRIRDLGTLGGTTSEARAINARGEVTGYAYTVEGNRHAFFWDGWTMRDLGTLGGDESVAFDMNKWGDVVGAADPGPDVPGREHPFIWNASSGMRNLGTIRGGADGTARAINSLTEVVGEAGVDGGTCSGIGGCHAFFWDGTMHDLGHLGFPSSTAVDLNNRGQIVGSSEVEPCPTCSRQTRAVLWTVRY